MSYLFSVESRPYRGKTLYESKYTKRNTWVYGDYYRVTDENGKVKHYIRPLNCDTRNRGILVNGNTVGQSTCFEARNEKLIYTWDIVRVGVKAGVVVWDAGLAGYAVYYPLEQNITVTPLGTLYWGNIEVIGNLFDTPDIVGMPPILTKHGLKPDIAKSMMSTK